MTVEEMLSLLRAKEDAANESYWEIRIFADESGDVLDDADEVVFGFTEVKELEEWLRS